jgi:D-amino-acid oxidase
MNSLESKPEAVVIGCGVVGLTSGIRLLEEGFRVKIITEEKPGEELSKIGSRDKKLSKITSLAAAAVWYPYSVHLDKNLARKIARKHDVAAYNERVERWAEDTYQRLEKLAAEPGTGVSFVRFVQVYKEKEKFEEEVRSDVFWWRRIVRRFEHPARALPHGYNYGYETEVPLMDTSVYLKYLMGRFTNLGGEIEPNCTVELTQLSGKRSLIINCTGVWSREFAADDEIKASRGQVIRIKRVGTINRCLLHIAEEPEADKELTYIIPRDTDCILGGTARECNVNEKELKPVENITRDILERCRQLEPSLNNINADDILEEKVGLRPKRHMVRLEYDMNQSRLIHNYGHGGDGFTLTWGCAEEVVRLALKGFK